MAFELGAGREKKTDALDHAVGVLVHHKVGDQVKKGDAIITWHANNEAKLANCRVLVPQSIALSDAPVEPLPLFYDVMFGERVKNR